LDSRKLPVDFTDAEIGRGKFGATTFNPKAPTQTNGRKRKYDGIGWMGEIRKEKPEPLDKQILEERMRK